MTKHFTFLLTLLALLFSCVSAATGQYLSALALFSLFACAVNPVKARTCLVTLSVPELLQELLESFKLQLFEVFGPNGITKDWKSNTAVLGDRITAKIAHVPTTQDYDNTPGPGHGFYGGAQDVVNLLEDVSVDLNRFKHVPIKISWLTGLSSKVDLFKAAKANIAFALVKDVVDEILAEAVNGCSNHIPLIPSLANFDGFDGSLRLQCNSQKMRDQNRWAIIGSDYASALGVDERTRSKLYADERNAAEGFRTFKNIGGFSVIREYPDVVNAATNLGGIMGDDRFIGLAIRRIAEMESVAKSLGIPEVMSFTPVSDLQTGLELTGVTWQEQGSGDVYLSLAILFGIHAGNGGAAPGSQTDSAGTLIFTQ